MDTKTIIELTRDIFGIPRGKLVIRRNGWVNMPCPLAPWRHEKGTDNTPSFGIKVNDTDTSVCNCYTCGYRRPVSDLVEEYASKTGKDLELEIELLRKEEYLSGEVPEWGELGSREELEELDPEKAIDPFMLEVYEDAKGHWYLEEREIDDQTAEELDLRIDEEDSEGEERILFPVFSLEGDLYGMTGRAVHSTARIKVRDYHGLDKRLLLLGLNRYSTDWKFVVLVEGLFDVARLVQYSLPVLGILGSTLTEPQAEIVKRLGLPVYLMFDNDKAGRKAIADSKKLLVDHLPLLTVQYPSRRVWNDKLGEWELVKDPDQLTYEEVMEMIDEACFA